VTLPADPAAAQLAAVTVVIVNHNAGGLLADCLFSVLPQAREVVVVDNASEPDAFEPWVATFAAHPRLQVIRSAKNLGFAAGCNLGATVATQPLLMFLNPDCVVAPGSLARLSTVLGQHPRAAMAGGLLTYTDGREQGGGRRAVPTPWRSFVRAFGLARFSNRWPGIFDDFHLHLQPLPAGPLPVEAISGACISSSAKPSITSDSWTNATSCIARISTTACGPGSVAGTSSSCPTRRWSITRACAAATANCSWNGTSIRA
jgi:GT2 family glycosyltransferase